MEPLPKEELVSYLQNPDNGLFKEVHSGDFGITVNLHPTDLMILNEWKRDEEQPIAEIRKRYENMIFFTLNLTWKNQELLNGVAGQPQAYKLLSDKIQFGLQDAIKLTDDIGEIKWPVFSVAPQTFGTGNGTRIMLGYDMHGMDNSDWVRLHIPDLGLGIGEQRIKFLVKDINNLPPLIYQPHAQASI